jgi:hypothetical protein
MLNFLHTGPRAHTNISERKLNGTTEAGSREMAVSVA